MPAIVPPGDPGLVGRLQIQSGAPVRGMTWSAAARAANYALGCSRALIPHCSPNVTLVPADGVQAIPFTVFRSYQATHRVWRATLQPAAEDKAIGTRFAFVDPSGGLAAWLCSGTGGIDSPQTFQHVERVTTRTAGEAVLAPTFASVAGTHVLTGLSCYELARPELAVGGDDGGLELESFAAGHWIYDSDGRSLGALPEAVSAALVRGRRTHLQWGRPESQPATFAGGYAPLLDYAPPILERQLYAGETQVAVPVRVRARVSAGGTGGNVRITMTNGAVLTMATVTSTTWAWYSGTIAVDVEDMTTADGRRASRWDQPTIEARRTAGAGTFQLAGVGIFGRGS